MRRGEKLFCKKVSPLSATFLPYSFLKPMDEAGNVGGMAAASKADDDHHGEEDDDEYQGNDSGLIHGGFPLSYVLRALFSSGGGGRPRRAAPASLF